MKNTKKMEQFKKEVKSIAIYLLNGCVSDEYAETLWELIEEDVCDNVYECSGYEEDEIFNDSDVRYAIGRILIERLESDNDTLYKLL
jgi:hypothetical protein